jgi:hypothetical protein
MSLAKHSPAETAQKLYKKPKSFPAKRLDTGHFLAAQNLKGNLCQSPVAAVCDRR